MRHFCAWCEKTLPAPPGDDPEDTRENAGICPECADRETAAHAAILLARRAQLAALGGAGLQEVVRR